MPNTVTDQTTTADTSNTEGDGPSPEVLHEAESQGWVPKDRFRGNEKDWVDAETFVKRGREILPIVKKQNENLLRDLQATKEQLKEFKQAAEEFKAFQKDNYERKTQALQAEIDQLKKSRAQAISDGDGEKVNELDDAIDQARDNLKDAKTAAREAVAAPVAAASPTIDPVLQTWLDRNKWFGEDRRMTGIANGIGESLRFENPNLKGQAFLEKLDEVLAEEFPAKFGKKGATNNSRVESGSGRQSRTNGYASNGRSYDNLPPEAKAACDRFVRQKLMTKEQYLSEYDWNE